jgi:hypothetical protein
MWFIPLFLLFVSIQLNLLQWEAMCSTSLNEYGTWFRTGSSMQAMVHSVHCFSWNRYPHRFSDLVQNWLIELHEFVQLNYINIFPRTFIGSCSMNFFTSFQDFNWHFSLYISSKLLLLCFSVQRCTTNIGLQSLVRHDVAEMWTHLKQCPHILFPNIIFSWWNCTEGIFTGQLYLWPCALLGRSRSFVLWLSVSFCR